MKRYFVAKRVIQSGKNELLKKGVGMDTHYRPNEFLKLTFYQRELILGYNFLKALYAKYPSQDLATMIQAMEASLFPAPKLTLVASEHLCMKCAMMIPRGEEVYTLIRKGDKSKGEADLYGNKHKDQCPMLKSPSERG